MKVITVKNILKVSEHQIHQADDFVAVEEPLEIRLSYGEIDDRHLKNIAITMRTPGNDEALAIGFLFNEAVIQQYDDILKITKTTYNKGELNENIITVFLKPDVRFNIENLHRNFYTTSSCGICGKASIDAINEYCSSKIDVVKNMISFNSILDLPIKMRENQKIFESTGGLHAAALFDVSGNHLFQAEDVGRHNALDKVAGLALLENTSLRDDKILMLSGRSSFELIQKSAMMGISIVCAVGAPSSLAISTALIHNITLIGFVKSGSFNVYTHHERIIF